MERERYSMKHLGLVRMMFLVPAAGAAIKVRCVTHDRLFSESMDASFHNEVNRGCVWEAVE